MVTPELGSQNLLARYLYSLADEVNLNNEAGAKKIRDQHRRHLEQLAEKSPRLEYIAEALLTDLKPTVVSSNLPMDLVYCEPFGYNPRKQQLTINGIDQPHLRPEVTSTLHLLILRHHQVVSAVELMEYKDWVLVPLPREAAKLAKVTISRVRDAIDDEFLGEKGWKYIQTVRGVGYMLAPQDLQ